ncbi:hypothetical protein N9J91_03220 [Gammaproteobacteria bacterium]|nr:hypothetical protein [Gammaproteobacteria bacterium]MDB4059573.1 hypothetical protein [Gammaproteobacteria bacterium]MDC1190863.1 hypothetical protein [Gammaproteobacteria bacterium]
MSIQDSEITVNKEDGSFIKKQQSGGLFLGFVFVLTLSSILALALWVNQLSSNNQTLVNSYEDRISLLEEELSIVDSVNADSMTGVAAQLQFLDKEIRKLWDLSNKRNKLKIIDLDKAIVDMNTKLQSLKDLNTKFNKLASSNELNLQAQSQKIKRIEISNSSITQLQKDLKAINTDNLLMEESIQAFDNYRKQINTTIFQLQNELRLVKDSLQSYEELTPEPIVNIEETFD